MLSTIFKLATPTLMAACLATGARAESYTYNFNFAATSPDVVNATGSFTVDRLGVLGVSDFTSWMLSVDGFPGSYVLTKANSTFDVKGNTTVSASASGLTFTVPTSSDGFEMNGTATQGSDNFQVDWLYAEVGPLSVISVTIPKGSIADGAIFLSQFPSTFTADAAVVVAQTPEPSSLLLMGTGGLLVAAGLKRRIASAAPLLP